MEGYFLIARSRKDNSFTVLKLREDWYLGREKGNPSVLTRENDLEAIDLVTTRFGSESEMAERMAMNGYIPDSDVDVFIASRREKDGRSYIKFDEVLYGQDKRTLPLRRIAQTSLAGDFRNDSYDLNYIYDEVISLAHAADDYLTMLLDGDMNVSKSFAEQLRCVRESVDAPYDLKEKVGFGAKDYRTVRNIVESMVRLQSLGSSSREEDRYEANSSFVGRNLSRRMAIIPELAIQLDKNYVEGQLSLFPLLDEAGEKKVIEATQAIAEEEKLIPAKIKVDRSISKEDKRKEIYRVLRHLPRGCVYREKQTNDFKVNYDLFSHYPVSEDEAKKLDTYLTGSLMRYFAEYMSDYQLLCQCNKDGFTPYSEIAEIQTDVEYDIKRIDKRFSSTKCLNMAYEWCMVFEGALERDKAVSEGAKVSSDTQEKPKVYGKK